MSSLARAIWPVTGIAQSGLSANRPPVRYVGQTYLATNLGADNKGMPIVAVAMAPDVWVNSSGTVV